MLSTDHPAGKKLFTRGDAPSSIFLILYSYCNPSLNLFVPPNARLPHSSHLLVDVFNMNSILLDAVILDIAMAMAKVLVVFNLVCFDLDLLHCFATVNSLVDLFECRAFGFW
jgi:hypothetical protein